MKIFCGPLSICSLKSLYVSYFLYYGFGFRLLFWSDVDGSTTRIITARFDGQQQVVIVDGVENLTALTVDQGEKGERVYWAQQRKIESAALDGSDRWASAYIVSLFLFPFS